MIQGQHATRSSSDEAQYKLTEHASLRMAQRNLKRTDIEYVISHGQRVYRTGLVFIFLGRRDMTDDEHQERARLEGATVLMNPKTREVVTVYRNRNGLRRIKRKLEHRLKEVG